MSIYHWSQTAATNATSDPAINMAEGMAPSAVNDGYRAGMAVTKKYVDDISGAIVTGGTSTAYTIASYSVYDTLAHLNGMMIAFTPHATNGATVTLNVDSLGAKPLRSAPNVELLAGTIIQGTPYVATYNNSDAVWYLQNFYGNPYNVPLAGGMDYWGTTVPNSGFAFPIGQAISRTTYSTLFSLIGTTYGVGDTSTTFNLPDKTGRASVMKEASASRLTSTYFGGNSTALGAVGGAESKTLLTANLPAYTPAGSVSVTNVNVPVPVRNYANSGATVSNEISLGSNIASSAGSLNVPGTASGSFTGTAQGGTSAPFATVQPTIVCNYIMRII